MDPWGAWLGYPLAGTCGGKSCGRGRCSFMLLDGLICQDWIGCQETMSMRPQKRFDDDMMGLLGLTMMVEKVPESSGRSSY